jgi:hypothetical protein
MLDFACRNFKEMSFVDADSSDAMEEFYWLNSDEYFLFKTITEKIVDAKSPEGIALDNLKRRKLWKRVFESKLIYECSGDKDEDKKFRITVMEIKKKIINRLSELEKENIYAYPDLADNMTFKDVEKSKLRIIEKSGDSYLISPKSWRKFKYELEILDYHLFIFRIYLKRSFQNPEQYKTFKMRVNSHIENELIELSDLFKLNGMRADRKK